MKRLLLKGSFIAYLLIGLEIFIMISPFAAYFYSFYSPIVNFLYASSYTGWLTEFFLPHFVFLDDPIIKLIGVIQVLTFFPGLFLFFYAAIPLYYWKFAKKGVVTKGFYCYIRHPQYLGLAMAGLGMLLYWPRFLILLTYVTMLFVYYLLSKNEEQRMLNKYGDSYKEYMDSVPMFLPGNIGGKFAHLFFKQVKAKPSFIALLYLFVILTTTGLAFLLRGYSTAAIPVGKVDNMAVVYVFPADKQEIADTMRLALSEDYVKKRAEESGATLAYIMPSDFFLMAILTDMERLYPPEFDKPLGGSTVKRFFKIFISYTKMQIGIIPEGHTLKRIIFLAVKDRDGKPLRGRPVFSFGARRYPVFHIDIDSGTDSIIAIEDLKPRHKWGDSPMPIF